jgi:DNA topoisomerase III
LTDDFKAEFDFGQTNENGQGGSEPEAFVNPEPLGPCPKCKHQVFEGPRSYLCEKAVGPGSPCDFRSGRIILTAAG